MVTVHECSTLRRHFFKTYILKLLNNILMISGEWAMEICNFKFKIMFFSQFLYRPRARIHKISALRRRILQNILLKVLIIYYCSELKGQYKSVNEHLKSLFFANVCNVQGRDFMRFRPLCDVFLKHTFQNFK